VYSNRVNGISYFEVTAQPRIVTNGHEERGNIA